MVFGWVLITTWVEGLLSFSGVLGLISEMHSTVQSELLVTGGRQLQTHGGCRRISRRFPEACRTEG